MTVPKACRCWGFISVISSSTRWKQGDGEFEAGPDSIEKFQNLHQINGVRISQLSACQVQLDRHPFLSSPLSLLSPPYFSPHPPLLPQSLTTQHSLFSCLSFLSVDILGVYHHAAILFLCKTVLKQLKHISRLLSIPIEAPEYFVFPSTA